MGKIALVTNLIENATKFVTLSRNLKLADSIKKLKHKISIICICKIVKMFVIADAGNSAPDTENETEAQ